MALFREKLATKRPGELFIKKSGAFSSLAWPFNFSKVVFDSFGIPNIRLISGMLGRGNTNSSPGAYRTGLQCNNKTT